ncbi:ParB N-terminal domain-containing protein [Pararhodobacter sp. SW119]|uniref:ParB/RepB/Spo0J family partition protein n=1 Tax=Pararhodobacter sp. SW119 TaxID=2780075 RepID=UPI001AE0C472|nr:ParB N-terminal domain-containing protein [Pararhodobacter sp. SW119]
MTFDPSFDTNPPAAPQPDPPPGAEAVTVVDMIPLDAVQIGLLLRDRARRLDDDLGDLKASIRDLGLSNPIRVQAIAQQRYELVQGWRRLSAFRALLAETGEARFARIPARLMPGGAALAVLYRQMVDENMVRKDISFAEMANLARGYVDQAELSGEDIDLDDAVNLLFASAGAQKRSYIRRFAWLLSRFDKHLEHPEAIPRALGMSLANRLDERPDLMPRLSRALQEAPGRSPEQELSILRQFADGSEGGAVALAPKPGRGRPAAPRARTRLHLMRDGEAVEVIATPGRVELHLARDLTTTDRARLRAAVAAFMDALDHAR